MADLVSPGDLVFSLRENMYHRAMIQRVQSQHGVKMFLVKNIGPNDQSSYSVTLSEILPFSRDNADYVKQFNEGPHRSPSSSSKSYQPDLFHSQTPAKPYPKSKQNKQIGPFLALYSDHTSFSATLRTPPILQLIFPFALDEILSEDYRLIKDGKMLHDLPRQPSIGTIVAAFIQSIRSQKTSFFMNVILAIPQYFDRFVRQCLLTQNELPQHLYWMTILTNHKSHPSLVKRYPTIEKLMSPSDIYGGEHLLRLLVELPAILERYSDIHNTAYRHQLKTILTHFLEFLEKYSEYIFTKPSISSGSADFDLSILTQDLGDDQIKGERTDEMVDRDGCMMKDEKENKTIIPSLESLGKDDLVQINEENSMQSAEKNEMLKDEDS
ncbi:putative MRG domain containing protein [Blattamonas nauphoetae]|uniref:MRG domain containing protein n=1 Tax=Blattamonas nauphoetae TaxID=2049346 RepID=A0ABQ9YMJ2_9EUKA|nr:putative MRG domain containing protein [Blattamonas nauphoetae]